MDDSDSDIEVLPSRRPTSTNKRPPPSPAEPKSSSAPPAPSTGTGRSSVEPSARPRAKRLARGPSVPVAGPPGSLAATGDAPDVTVSRSASAESKGKGKAVETVKPEPQVVKKAVQSPKKAVPAGGDSSDELDDFFTKKPKPTAQRRLPKGKAAVPVQSYSSSPEEDSDSEPESTSTSTRPLNLPLWTKGISGAEKAIMASTGSLNPGGGARKNRKKKVLGESTDEEDREKERQEEMKRRGLEAKMKMPVKSEPKGKGKEKEKAERGLLSSSSDSSASEAEEAKLGDKRRRDGRSRSKSLTPPAPMSEWELRAALDRVRNEHSTSSAAPPHFMHSNHTNSKGGTPLGGSSPAASQQGDLDPSLRNILSSRHQHNSDILYPEDRAGPNMDVEEGEQVTIEVSMIWDPDKPGSERAKKHAERFIPYTHGINQSFTRLFRLVASTHPLLSSSGTITEDELVFTYSKRRVYGFGTPTSLKILHSAQFRVCTLLVSEKLNAQGERHVSVDREMRDEDPLAASPSGSGSGSGSGGDAEEAEREREETPKPTGQQQQPFQRAPSASQPPSDASRSPSSAPTLFKISVRGSATQILSVAVKRSTTMQQLLKSYAKRFGVEAVRRDKMWVEWEGERLGSTRTVGELEEEEGIEEEDMLEVREGQ